MKVGILTLPLWNNYGGILQSYALSNKVRGLGHETVIIDFQHKKKSNLNNFSINLKNKMKMWFFKGKTIQVSDAIKVHISQNTRRFVETELGKISRPIYDSAGLYAINGEIDGVIVGSDQVWRPEYTPKYQHYFLDFLSDDKTRISYAASFGKDDLNLPSEKIEFMSKNLSKFKSVSVREATGLDFVHNNLGVNEAVQVVDPTFLMSKDEYIFLCDKYCDGKNNKGKIFTYILDWNIFANKTVKSISDSLGLDTFEVKPNKIDTSFTVNDSKYIYPCVTDWLRAFRDAEFIIADSFHGCVFSIIFNKPFIAIGNKTRGLARFNSLLETFDLQQKLVLSSEDVNRVISSGLKEFDWVKINQKSDELKKESLIFLKDALSVKTLL